MNAQGTCQNQPDRDKASTSLEIVPQNIDLLIWGRVRGKMHDTIGTSRQCFGGHNGAPPKYKLLPSLRPLVDEQATGAILGQQVQFAIAESHPFISEQDATIGFSRPDSP